MAESTSYNNFNMWFFVISHFLKLIFQLTLHFNLLENWVMYIVSTPHSPDLLKGVNGYRLPLQGLNDRM